MAVPRRNGLREEDEEDEALFEEDDGLVLLPESDTPPHLRDLAAAAELGDLAALRRALGIHAHPHKRVNSPPVLPDPVPNFPGLPMPLPPGPDIPRPPMPSPPRLNIPLGPSDVLPPHAPDIIPPKPPRPRLPPPKSPGIEEPSRVVFESFVLKWWNAFHWT
ncbi:hypothetical protein TEA_023575 [Camellia sinensis var. sinensis]|uniref:Uncharacterized protein n=1 Tax=Camellia sinensis var. sinensis TaxID=542762 RepID=A0A4S4E264_CAMSN|nr:hypothetical protein TEA_023575 [Camellia sinensis var. sinensis]